MQESKQITFSVFRFNSERDYLPAYKTYTLTVEKHEVLLDILRRLKSDVDSSLGFRCSCRHGICGACAVKVNQKSVLACKQNVFELCQKFGDSLTIEPLSIKRALKDLIIDKNDFWGKYAAVEPCLDSVIDEHPSEEHIVAPQSAATIDDADYCIQCGACFYACPSVQYNERFLGPAALTQTYRFVSDERDGSHIKRLEQVNESGQGVWDCVKCFECSLVCPKGVDPIGKITRLGTKIFSHGVGQNGIGAKQAEGFTHSVIGNGIANEAEVIRFSEGVCGSIKHIPDAIELAGHGKLVLPWDAPQCGNIDEIHKLADSSTVKKD